MSENAVAEPQKGSAGASSAASFFEEAADVWKRLPHKLLFGIVFAAWIALFHFFGNATFGYAKTQSLFLWLSSVYDGIEDDAHGRYVPIVVLIFFWWKRKELMESMGKVWWPAIFYFAGAILLHLAAYRIQQARVSALAFILGFHAILGLLWGREWLRRTIFPVFLLLFSIPFGSLANIITVDLRILVTKVSVGLTHHIGGIEVFSDGSRILGANGKPMYEVAPACSGMRSLIALTALSVIYSFMNFDTVWKRALLIACGVPLAIIANIIRISTVIVVGDTWGQKAGAMIEQKFGFLTFVIAIAGMMGIGWLIREKSSDPPPPSTPAVNPQTA